MNHLISRVMGKYHRTLAYRCCRRRIAIKTPVPMISFSFDDAPRTAFDTGGAILRSYGTTATFFVSLGLVGSETEAGMIATPGDLTRAVDQGNELGCHTFDHLDTWETTTDNFLASVLKNRQALQRIVPEAEFKTFAYPMSEPRPAVKSRLKNYFMCCRGGGQTPNIGTGDLNLLRACFLDRRNGIDIEGVKKWIDYNASHRGWLIFATHDVAESPSPFGCTAAFFREVVEHAARSGALLLPVGKACERLLNVRPGLS